MSRESSIQKKKAARASGHSGVRRRAQAQGPGQGHPRSPRDPLGPAKRHPRATQDHLGRPKRRQEDPPDSPKRAPGGARRPPKNYEKRYTVDEFRLFGRADRAAPRAPRGAPRIVLEQNVLLLLLLLLLLPKPGRGNEAAPCAEAKLGGAYGLTGSCCCPNLAGATRQRRASRQNVGVRTV